MEDYLGYIQGIADSLAAIREPISDLELTDFTLSGLDPEYETIATVLQYFPGQNTFDDLRTKLIMFEHKLKFRKARDGDAPTQQAFQAASESAAVVPNVGASSTKSSQASGVFNNKNRKGRNNRWNNNWNNGQGNNRNNRGNNNNRGSQGQPASYSNSGLLSLSAYCDSVVLCNNVVNVDHVPNLKTGNASFDGILDPSPTTMPCKICYYTGHPTSQCPFRSYNISRTPNAPSLATMSLDDANEAQWYPDSGASAHMTPNAGQDNWGGSTSGFQ